MGKSINVCTVCYTDSQKIGELDLESCLFDSLDTEFRPPTKFFGWLNFHRVSYTKGYTNNDFNLIFYEYYCDRSNIFLLKYYAINSTIFFKPIVYALKFSLRFFQFYKNALGHRNVIHFQLKLSFVSKLSSEFSFKNFLKRKVFFFNLKTSTIVDYNCEVPKTGRILACKRFSMI